MDEDNKQRRSAKDLREEVSIINRRKPSDNELKELVNLIRENAEPDIEGRQDND